MHYNILYSVYLITWALHVLSLKQGEMEELTSV